MKDYIFNRMMEQRYHGVVHAAAPEQRALSMGYGQTLKQARANAVGFYKAVPDRPLLYTFLDPTRPLEVDG